MLAHKQSTIPTELERIETLENQLLQMDQVECPVIHHFGPGIYIREVHLPAGILAIGHAQRFKHTNVMLKGKVAIIGDDGQLKILEAPLFFIGEPGRKIGHVIEDTIWQNIYATDETDIDVLESTYLDKSDTWNDHNQDLTDIRTTLHYIDRIDFDQLISQLGITHELVRTMSENESDQVSMPIGSAPKFTVRDSYIEGKGVFLSAPVKKGEIIAPARINCMRTPAGRYTNHAKNPNAKFILMDSGDIYLMALKDIHGCVGGEKGEEVTIDYRQALELSDIKIEDI